MNLKFLETFVWVARLKSFRLTAEKLFSTQASVSSRIAVLEGELGVKLFVRDSRGARLTPEGQQVLEYAEQILDTCQALREAIDAGRVSQGRVRIGAMDTVVHTWLSLLVARIAERLPNVEVELMADTAINLAEQLRKGYLDLVFQTDHIRDESVHNRELGSYPLRWLAARGSPQHRHYADMHELAGERVVTFSKHSRPHLDLLSMLQSRGIELPRLSCINSVAAMTRLVSDAYGISALPPVLVGTELRRGELVKLQVEPPPDLPLLVSWRGGSGLDLVERVLELSREVLSDYALEVGAEGFTLAYGGNTSEA